MRTAKVFPNFLVGEINPPPSKSLCHRAIIAAALAQGQSIIDNVTISEDILATIKGVQALGAVVNFQNNRLVIEGGRFTQEDFLAIDCHESGSTLRFLIPLGLALGKGVTYTGQGNLGNRPLGPYLNIFDQQGITYSSKMLPMEIKGVLRPGEFELEGNVSSQFITGLLFSLPLLESDSTIVVKSKLESLGYIDLTLDILESFGVHVENDQYQRFFIKGGQQYKPQHYQIEADYSQAAFWLVAAALNGEITCKGLNPNSKQGDRFIIDILKKAGARIEQYDQNIKVTRSDLDCFDVDVSQYPDIAPILAVAAAFSNGTSHITGAGRLRIKECDRLKAIVTELEKLGASITEHEDSITIQGREFLHGGKLDSWDDHRIAMSLSVAALRSKEPVYIQNSDSVNKSYPSFFEDFIMLGGKIDERNMG